MNLGQVFTDKTIANYMVSLFSISKDSPVLDPCFGEGVFIKSLMDDKFSNITGVEIDSTLFNNIKEEFKGLHLFNKDFLMSFGKSKYNGIIMNPPYIRHEEIDNLKLYGITKKQLLSNDLFKELSAKSNLYMYFIIKAISLLKSNGELIVIFPSSWINAKNGNSFKKIIEQDCSIEKQINISGKVFNKKALVDVVILKIKKSKDKKKTIFKVLGFDGKNIFERKQQEKIDICLPQKFSDIALIKRGLTTGYNQMFINPSIKNKVNLLPIISSPKQIDGYSIKKQNYDLLLKIKDFDLESQKYISHFEKEIKLKQKPRTLYNKIISKEPNWFSLKTTAQKGVVFSYFVRSDMKFILNETNIVIRDNFYVITPKINVFLLFALLNNLYTYYQLECIGKKYGNGLLKIQSYDFKNLSFPIINSESDIKELEKLSKLLIETNNEDIIYEITKIISKYTNIDLTMIKNAYFSIRNFRLEEKL